MVNIESNGHVDWSDNQVIQAKDEGTAKMKILLPHMPLVHVPFFA